MAGQLSTTFMLGTGLMAGSQGSARRGGVASGKQLGGRKNIKMCLNEPKTSNKITTFIKNKFIKSKNTNEQTMVKF
jgi:hypothetical protein